jgi:hypothetical protein
MQFQNNFDLEEFLAYLLPGFVCSLLVFSRWSSEIAAFVPSLNRYGPEYAILFICITLFITVSLALGHLCGLFARNLLRPFLNLLLGDPEQSIILSRQRRWTDKGFYSAPFLEAVSARFKSVFGLTLDDRLLWKAAPRLIRSYVIVRSPIVAVVRDRVVRSRSLCANMVLPAVAAAIIFRSELSWQLLVSLLVVAILLVVKQVSLDIRESKEIYTAFLVLDVVGH